MVDGSLDALPSEVDLAWISTLGFGYEADTELMMPIWSPKLKKRSDDEGVSTTLAQHLDKDFVGAEPSPTSANDTIMHTRDVTCGTFQDDL